MEWARPRGMSGTRCAVTVARGRRSLRILFRPLVPIVGVEIAYLMSGVARLSARRVGLALVYHGVAEQPASGGAELLPAHEATLFEAQLRHLEARYQVVPASALKTAVEARGRGQRFPVAITFDDDLPSHTRVAMPALERVGLPATFFVCGASLRAPFAFWWERLQSAVDRGIQDLPPPGSASAADSAGARSAETIEAVALQVEELNTAERDAFAAMLESRLGGDPPGAGMRAGEIEALAARGFEIGFHTRRHDRLPPLPDDGLAAAMSDGRAEIEEVLGRRLAAISYPHGKADARVATAARAAGFRYGFTGRAEPILETTDALLMGRLGPSYSSLGRFAFQLASALSRGG